MGNLIKPSDYAKKLGISRQAVYAKIKKGILTSKNVDGKLYIVEQQDTPSTPAEPASRTASASAASPAQTPQNFHELLAAKDETITVLKETITDLKETNQMITSTLRSEVELLKEAFSEMKNIYANQIEHLQPEETPEPIDLEEALEDFEADIVSEPTASPAQTIESILPDEGDELAWIELEDFFDEHDIRKQSRQEKIAKRIKKLYKKGDSRIDSFEGEWILLADADFSDILKKKK